MSLFKSSLVPGNGNYDVPFVILVLLAITEWLPPNNMMVLNNPFVLILM